MPSIHQGTIKQTHSQPGPRPRYFSECNTIVKCVNFSGVNTTLSLGELVIRNVSTQSQYLLAPKYTPNAQVLLASSGKDSQRMRIKEMYAESRNSNLKGAKIFELWRFFFIIVLSNKKKKISTNIRYLFVLKEKKQFYDRIIMCAIILYIIKYKKFKLQI